MTEDDHAFQGKVAAVVFTLKESCTEPCDCLDVLIAATAMLAVAGNQPSKAVAATLKHNMREMKNAQHLATN